MEIRPNMPVAAAPRQSPAVNSQNPNATTAAQQFAALAAQKTVALVQQTQTVKAPQAAAGTEKSQSARTATQTGRAFDNDANAVIARSDSRRGAGLDALA
jgi:hypothetical protein